MLKSIKNLKIKKKMLPFLLASTFVLSATGCSSKENTDEVAQYDIQMIDYNEEARKLQYERITSEELASLESADKIAAKQQENEDLQIVATYFSIGYFCGNDRETNMTKEQAKQENPSYSSNEDFLKGYDTGKEDKYLEIAEEERQQYVSVTTGAETDLDKEVNFYPLNKLYVASFSEDNILIYADSQENILSGNYQVVLGEDLKIENCIINNLRNFATDNSELIEDSEFIIPAGYRVIPEITPETFPTKVTQTQKTR